MTVVTVMNGNMNVR